MSLSGEQKKDLNQIGEYFRQLELITVENSIDLDVFMSEYNADGFSVYATEKVSLESESDKRKEVFQKASKEKNVKTIKSTFKNS